MSLHYILDGYNLVKKTSLWADKKLEDGRVCLVNYIKSTQPQGSIKNKVTIVFDGQPGIGGDIIDGVPTVIFTQGETADDKIKEMVEQAKLKKSLIVVTDDREIQYYVRALGAKVLGVHEFIGSIVGSKGDGLKSSASKKRISQTMEYKINSELKNIWLKKND